MYVIICLNLLCSLCPLAFGAPEAIADPDIIIKVEQIVGSSDLMKDNGGGLSDDGAAGEESADEGPAVTEAPTEQGYTTEAPLIECPATWEGTGQGCYKFLTGAEDWLPRTEAEAACDALDGAKLAVLDTEEKRAAMAEYFVAKGGSFVSTDADGYWFFVGARTIGDKHLWDGTTVEVEGWSVKNDQPFTEDGECVSASGASVSGVGLNDIFELAPCDIGYLPLCELNNSA